MFKCRSCLSQLLEHQDRLLNQVSANENIDVVFLDFEKAFDKVDHGILSHKLKTLGITGKLGVWLHNFLTSRSQVVTTNGATSKKCQVSSRVPQGTVLGLLLFLILMVDFNRGVQHAALSSFADDTNISMTVASPDDVKKL